MVSKREHKAALRLSYVVGFIFVLLPFHALLTTWLGSNTGHLDLIRIWKELLIALLTLPAAWLFFKSDGLKTWGRRSFLAQLIALYFLIHIAFGIWGIKHNQLNSTALIYALIINLRFLGFFLVCLILASYSDWLKLNWRRLLTWPAAIVVVLGLAQKFFLPYDFLRHFGYGPKTIPAYQTIDSDLNFRRIQSTLRGANPLGAYMVLATTSFLFIRSNITKLTFFLASLLVLYFSYSRSAWIGLALTLGVIGLWQFSGSRKLKELLAAGLVILALAGLGAYALRGNHSAQDTLFHTSSVSTNVSSNAQRSSAIKNAASDVLHNPLGRGPGTAGPASFRNNGHPARIAENYYLQIAQEVGVIGALIFILINLIIGRQLWLMRQDNLARLLLASLIGISFINLVSHAWTDDTLSLLWWGLAGISLSASFNLKPSKA